MKYYKIIRGNITPLNDEDADKLLKDPKWIKKTYHGADMMILDEDKFKMAPLIAAELQDFKMPTFTIFLVASLMLQAFIFVFGIMTYTSIPADKQDKILASIDAMGSRGS